jgi:hypothetical protein
MCGVRGMVYLRYTVPCQRTTHAQFNYLFEF